MPKGNRIQLNPNIAWWGNPILGRYKMIVKVLSVATLLLAVVTAGCGLAIHFKWVGEVEPLPHMVLGTLVVLLALATAVAAVVVR